MMIDIGHRNRYFERASIKRDELMNERGEKYEGTKNNVQEKRSFDERG